MKQEINVRVRVLRPLSGVSMQVQRGRDEFLGPLGSSAGELVFEFPLNVDMSADRPNFLGKYAQGPKDSRFIYVNSGTYAGQAGSCWSRRAKIPLIHVTREQVERALRDGLTLETSFEGVGRDGGPTCASVKGVEWRVTK